MSQNVKNRIEWIDYSKGILIILVIAGHAIPEFDLHLDYLAHFIYSFHMPAFFILSGYLFRYKKDINTVEFAKKKAKQLLIPYIIFSCPDPLWLPYRHGSHDKSSARTCCTDAW